MNSTQHDASKDAGISRRGNCLEHAQLLWRLNNGGFFMVRRSRVSRLLVPHVLYTEDFGVPDETGWRCVGLYRRNGGYLAWGSPPRTSFRCTLFWRLTLRGVKVRHLVPDHYDHSRRMPPAVFAGHEIDYDG